MTKLMKENVNADSINMDFYLYHLCNLGIMYKQLKLTLVLIVKIFTYIY